MNLIQPQELSATVSGFFAIGESKWGGISSSGFVIVLKCVLISLLSKDAKTFFHQSFVLTIFGAALMGYNTHVSATPAHVVVYDSVAGLIFNRNIYESECLLPSR
jgi:hypothetical protein